MKILNDEELKESMIIFFFLFILGNGLELLNMVGYEYLDLTLAYSLDIAYFWVFFMVILFLMWFALIKRKN